MDNPPGDTLPPEDKDSTLPGPADKTIKESSGAAEERSDFSTLRQDPVAARANDPVDPTDRVGEPGPQAEPGETLPHRSAVDPAPSATSEPDSRRFGDYELLRKIAHGGM